MAPVKNTQKGRTTRSCGISHRSACRRSCRWSACTGCRKLGVKSCRWGHTRHTVAASRRSPPLTLAHEPPTKQSVTVQYKSHANLLACLLRGHLGIFGCFSEYAYACAPVPRRRPPRFHAVAPCHPVTCVSLGHGVPGTTCRPAIAHRRIGIGHRHRSPVRR